MKLIDIFGEEVEITEQDIESREAYIAYRAMTENGIPRRAAYMWLVNKPYSLEAVEYAMSLGDLVHPIEWADRLCGESWKEYAIREARLDPKSEEDRIMPQ